MRSFIINLIRIVDGNNNTIWLSFLLISESLSSLFCTIAGAIPKSLITPKKEMITVAIATITKSSGVKSRDRIAVIIKEMTTPAYFDMPV